MYLRRRILATAIAAVRHYNTAAIHNSGKLIPSCSSPLSSPLPWNSWSFVKSKELGKRVLSLVYAKRSVAVTLNDWIKEGNHVIKYDVIRLVKELRRLKRYKHALEMLEWMKTKKDFKLSPGDYAIQLDLIDKLHGLNSAEQFFQDMPEEMNSEPILSSLLHTYVQHNAYDKAEALMEKISKCDHLESPLPYNHMMTMYLKNGKLEKIPMLMSELKKKTTPDIVSYNLWLTMCQSQNDVEAAEHALLELKRAKIEPDWFTYSIITILYTKNEQYHCAKSALKEMEKRVSRKHRASYASLISLHAPLRNKKGVDRIWKTMKSMYAKLNDEEYACMISSLLKLGEVEKAEKIYEEWELVSPTRDSRIANLLLENYINENKIEKAKTFFHRCEVKGIKPSYGTWELLTRANLKAKQTGQALYYFERALFSVKMRERILGIVCEIYQYLEEEQDTMGAEELLSLLSDAGHVTTEIYNCHLRTYAKAGKMPLFIEERMTKDGVLPDSETNELVKITSNMSEAKDVEEQEIVFKDGEGDV